VKAADDREDAARDRATALQNRVDSGVSQNMAEPIRIIIADDDVNRPRFHAGCFV
jgi:hypothetical protein